MPWGDLRPTQTPIFEKIDVKTDETTPWPRHTQRIMFAKKQTQERISEMAFRLLFFLAKEAPSCGKTKMARKRCVPCRSKASGEKPKRTAP